MGSIPVMLECTHTHTDNILYINVEGLCHSVKRAPVHLGQCSNLVFFIMAYYDLCLLEDVCHCRLAGETTGGMAQAVERHPRRLGTAVSGILNRAGLQGETDFPHDAHFHLGLVF
jgi:hypothetical protein